MSLEPWAAALIALGALGTVVVLARLATRAAFFDVRGRTVLITGGSSGIGKATAAEMLRRGAHVALLARRESLLKEAALELAGPAGSLTQRVTTHAADVSDEAAVTAAVRAAAAAHGGRIDVVIASAGVSGPRRFEETPASEFESTWRINVLGCRNVVAAALPFMAGGAEAAAAAGGGGGSGAPALDGGRIVLVSSQAGQTGVYGYTAYSSSKFALRGLFDALAQELATRRILCTLAFPPDTDTPMLAEENKYKPRITRLLSETTATVQPGVVAAAIVDGVLRWRPFVSVGFDGWMLANLTAGMSQPADAVDGVVGVLTAGLWRAAGIAVTAYFYWIIRRNDAPTATATAAAAPPPHVPAAAEKAGKAATGKQQQPRRGSESGGGATKRASTKG